MMTRIDLALVVMILVGACGGEMPKRDCDNPPPGIPNCEEAAAAAAAASAAAKKASEANGCDTTVLPYAGPAVVKSSDCLPIGQTITVTVNTSSITQTALDTKTCAWTVDADVAVNGCVASVEFTE